MDRRAFLGGLFVYPAALKAALANTAAGSFYYDPVSPEGVTVKAGGGVRINEEYTTIKGVITGEIALGSFASLIQYINGSGTDPDYEVTIGKDSIYIPPGNSSRMFFFAEPTDHPCNLIGTSCGVANTMPDGDYRLAAWINGYTDQGETFGRSVVLGNILVDD